MDQTPGLDIPAGGTRYATKRDLKSLEKVEKHLRARLEVERRSVATSISSALVGVAPALPWEGRTTTEVASLPWGRLSALALTMDKETYRAYLKNSGNTTVLYINFNLGTFLVMALMPHGASNQ